MTELFYLITFDNFLITLECVDSFYFYSFLAAKMETTFGIGSASITTVTKGIQTIIWSFISYLLTFSLTHSCPKDLGAKTVQCPKQNGRKLSCRVVSKYYETMNKRQIISKYLLKTKFRLRVHLFEREIEWSAWREINVHGEYKLWMKYFPCFVQ